MKKLILNVCFFICTVWIAEAQWKLVGNSGFSQGNADDISIVFFKSVPHVVYTDFHQGYAVNVKKFDGTNWVNVGQKIPPACWSPSLAFVQSTPYVAYSDLGNSAKATVKKFNGVSWVNVGSPGFSAGIAESTTLAAIGNTPYVAYSDGAYSGKITVKRFDGTAWVNVGVPGFSAGDATNISLVFHNKTPYLCFTDEANSHKVTVMKFTGKKWEPIGPQGFTPGVSKSPSIAFKGNIPFVAFIDISNSSKVSVMKFTGLVWEYEGSPGFTQGNRSTSIAFKSGDVAYLALDRGGINVFKFNGASWVQVGSPDFYPGHSPSLAIANGIPYVAFQTTLDFSNATVMKYRYLPIVDVEHSLTKFLSCGSISSEPPQSFRILGDDITKDIGIAAPAGFEVSASRDGKYLSNLKLKQRRGMVLDTTIYIRMSSTNIGTLSGNVVCISRGAKPVTIPVSGEVHRLPTISISGITEICTGQTITLTASGASTYQWNEGPATAEYRVSPTTTSRYTVTGTNANSCSNTTTVSVTVSRCDSAAHGTSKVGKVEENESLIKIAVYSSPSNDYFNVDIPASFGSTVTIEVINLKGELVFRKENQPTAAPIAIGTGLSEGVYTLRIITTDKVSTQKIMVTK